MASDTQVGFNALGQQAALILGIAALAWCVATGVGLLETIFRVAVVYLVASIIAIWLRGILVRMVNHVEVEAARLQAETGESEGEAESMPGGVEE